MWATYIIPELVNAGYSAYLCGGAVRDMMLGITPKDYDICTSATPDEVKSIFKKCKIIDSGIEYGTITIMFESIGYEVTTYRQELGYADGRHPVVAFSKDIKEDLKRRDFTINACAYNPINEEYIDFFSGREDLNNKIIRAVGNAEERFTEDALRIMRAIRFACKLNFNIEDKTFEAMKNSKDNIKNISIERIYDELIKILTYDARKGLYLLHDCGILDIILPEVDAMYGYNQDSPYHDHNLFDHTINVIDCFSINKRPDMKDNLRKIYLITALLHDIGKPYTRTWDDKKNCAHYIGHEIKSYEMAKVILKRLKVSNFEYEKVTSLIYHHMDKFSITSRVKFKRKLKVLFENDIHFDGVMAFNKADKLSSSSKNINDYMKYYNEVNRIYNDIQVHNEACDFRDLRINGDTLINELDMKQGKLIKVVLDACMDYVIQKPEKNNNKELIEYARKFLDKLKQKELNEFIRK